MSGRGKGGKGLGKGGAKRHIKKKIYSLFLSQLNKSESFHLDKFAMVATNPANP